VSGLIDKWRGLDTAHRKALAAGAGGWLFLCLLAVVYMLIFGGRAARDWEDRIPAAVASVDNTYAAPQFGMNAKAVPDGRAYIAIIVSGLGLMPDTTEFALRQLPKEIALSFSPYGADVDNWVHKSVSDGHETIMMMPMESATYPIDDPGPRALSSRLSDKENNTNLDWILSRAEGSVAVMNYMGSRFLSDARRITPVFELLRRNGTMFVENPTTEKSIAEKAAAQASLPYLRVDLAIDGTPTPTAIQAQLSKLESIALKNGVAIGVAEPYPVTFDVLKAWGHGLEKKGIVLAPLSTIWKNTPRHDEAPTQQQP